jgi:hypothetical protein|tara:strand:+ start:163 stop:288 length:126 start_codon:yes stop_codon:yes gene_type:complete
MPGVIAGEKKDETGDPNRDPMADGRLKAMPRNVSREGAVSW